MSLILEKHDSLEYFVPENIKTPAIFTTRLGGVSGSSGEDKSSPLYSLNLGFKDKYDDNKNVEKNYKIIAEILGFSVNNIIYAHQKHTDNVLICDKKFSRDNKNNMLALPDDYIFDAMVTDTPGVLLTARTADCVPVLFWDEEHKAVGAAHCGWRGTLNKLQIKTALKMRELYNTDLSKLKTAIGPGISKCCYEVSGEFYKNFTDILGDRVKIYFKEKDNSNNKNNKYMCDLKGVNKMLLLDLLGEKNIEISQNCTYCEEELFFSHRRQGEYRGTHAAFIGIL
ncbi:MAG: peptidoglycan editing factor PgeF [Oscillospiraceae bacterium]|nr:peptidoglycan editing factor PgeF [Oscillospiraceae bacterium]